MSNSAPSVFVVGPEGSGTTLLWKCVTAHPELQGVTAAVAPTPGLPVAATGVIMHLSLPTLRPMLWVPPEDVPKGSKVVVLRRSPVHTVYSAYRRFFDDPAEAWRTYFHAVGLEGRYLALHDPLCVFYEALTCNPAKVLRAVYEWLGVAGDFLPSIQWRDRNDERWRTDAVFAEFMRDTFGEIAAGEPVSADLDDAAHASPAPRGGGTGGLGETARGLTEAGQGTTRVVPARYVRIDDLLEPREHARLLAYAHTREVDFTASTVISTDRTFRVESEFRRSGTLEELEDVWDLFEARLRRLLPHVRRELELQWFPLGRIERQMAVHRDGGFFRAHADNTDAAVAGRCLTCVYYFHDHPKRFTGGELWLYDTVVRGTHAEKGNRYVSIDPADNTAVFFASDVYHEVRPVCRQSESFGDSRFSINVWFWLGETPQCIILNPLDGPAVEQSHPSNPTNPIGRSKQRRRSMSKRAASRP